MSQKYGRLASLKTARNSLLVSSSDLEFLDGQVFINSQWVSFSSHNSDSACIRRNGWMTAPPSHPQLTLIGTTCALDTLGVSFKYLEKFSPKNIVLMSPLAVSIPFPWENSSLWFNTCLYKQLPPDQS